MPKLTARKVDTLKEPGLHGDGGSPPFKAAMIQELKRAELRRSDFVEYEVPGMICKH